MENIIEFKEPNCLTEMVIDIETLSTKSNALIVSVGAVLFDYRTFRINSTHLKDECIVMYEEINLSGAEREFNFNISVDVVQWWIEQTEKKSGAFPSSKAKLSIKIVLELLIRVIHEVDISKPNKNIQSIWAHSNFDHNILYNACDQVGLEYFDYRKVRDLRTLEMIGKKFGIDRTDSKYKSMVSHNAYHDALAEAVYVSDVLKKLDEVLENEK